MPRKLIIKIDDFTGGINTFDKKHKIKDNQSPYTKNAVFSQKGAIRKRFGFDRICSLKNVKGGMRGLIPYIKLPTEATENIERKLLCVFEDKILLWEEGFEEFEEVGTLSSQSFSSYCRGAIYNNEVIIGDGESDTVKWDGIIGNDFITFNAPKSNCFLVYSEIFCARDSETPSVMKYADPDDITKWIPGILNNAGFVAPEENNGEIIKGLAKFQNKLFIFKETGKFSAPIQFDEENKTVGFSVSEFDDVNSGSIAPYAILNTPNSLFYLGENGFESYGMQENFPDRRASKKLSFAIENILETINNEKEELISSMKWGNKYLRKVCKTGKKSWSRRGNVSKIKEP